MPASGLPVIASTTWPVTGMEALAAAGRIRVRMRVWEMERFMVPP